MELSVKILLYINQNTHRENLEEKSTKQIADKFEISTQKAYNICTLLAQSKQITKLDPVNGQKFDCCGWIRNNDDEKPETITISIQGNNFTAISQEPLKEEAKDIVYTWMLSKDNEVVGHLGMKSDGSFVADFLLVGQHFFTLKFNESEIDFEIQNSLCTQL